MASVVRYQKEGRVSDQLNKLTPGARARAGRCLEALANVILGLTDPAGL